MSTIDPKRLAGCILIVEDDAKIAADIALTLQAQSYSVRIAATGQEALKLVRAHAFDAMTLDRMLPDVDGIALLRALRAEHNFLPVLVISALSDVDERIRGIRAGGDDYLTKPYHPGELVARLEGMISRLSTPNPATLSLLRVGNLQVDLFEGTVRRGDRVIELSSVEYRLLVFMIRHRSQILSRPMLFEGVWGYRFDPGTNIIEVHIGQLRKKIDLPGDDPLFFTIRNKGYRLGR